MGVQKSQKFGFSVWVSWDCSELVFCPVNIGGRTASSQTEEEGRDGDIQHTGPYHFYPVHVNHKKLHHGDYEPGKRDHTEITQILILSFTAETDIWLS